jgi:hypothetical protein
MTRKSRRSAAPGLQYARTSIRIDKFPRNSKVLSPGAPYWSKLNGWKFHDKIGAGVAAAAAAAAMAFARSLCFSCSANVADPAGFSAACRRRTAAREDQIVTSIAVLRGTRSEGDLYTTNYFSMLAIRSNYVHQFSIPQLQIDDRAYVPHTSARFSHCATLFASSRILYNLKT